MNPPNPYAGGCWRLFYAIPRQCKAHQAAPAPLPPLDRRLHAINAMQLDGHTETAKACLKILRQ